MTWILLSSPVDPMQPLLSKPQPKPVPGPITCDAERGPRLGWRQAPAFGAPTSGQAAEAGVGARPGSPAA